MLPTSLYSALLAPWLQCACFFSILLFPACIRAQVSTQNTTISLGSPQIIYTPFLCGRDNTSADCNGGWERQHIDGSKTVSTTGPNQLSNNIIPQMFFDFRGSALYLFASSTSNAQANITITTNGTTVSATFDSTLGQASILNLDPSSITKFALTFLPSNDPREFSLSSMIISIPKGALTTTLPLLQSMTLPPSSSAPIYTPSPTLSQTIPSSSPGITSNPQPVSSSKHSNIAIAVGVTIGIGLGLTALAGFSFWWCKRRRPKRRWIKSLTAGQTNVPREIGFEGFEADNFRETPRIGAPDIGDAFRFGEGRPRSVSPVWRDSSEP